MSVEDLRQLPGVPLQPAVRDHTIPLRKLGRKLMLPLVRKIPEGAGIGSTSEIHDIMSDFLSKPDLDRDQTPKGIVFENMFPVGNNLFLFANRQVHPDMWYRDYVFASEYIDTSSIDENIQRNFEQHQRRNGQIPTAIGVTGVTGFHLADDETTMLYIIQAARTAKRSNGDIQPSINSVGGALSFIHLHVSDERYVSPHGDRRGWFDSFIYPQSDVITQNQGLYAVTLLAADSLGFPVDAYRIQRAKKLYRASASFHRYLPLSARFNRATDASVLYPEYLAMTIFGEQLLDDATVSATLDHLPRSNWGFKVVATSPRGDYFDPHYFIHGSTGGTYQNGAVWKIWDNTAQGVGELHGVLSPSYRMRNREVLSFSGWSESIRTGGKNEERIYGDNHRQLWNVAVVGQHRVLDQIKSAA